MGVDGRLSVHSSARFPYGESVHLALHQLMHDAWGDTIQASIPFLGIVPHV